MSHRNDRSHAPLPTGVPTPTASLPNLLLILLPLTLVTGVQPAHAETRYITDQLDTELRAAPGTGQKVVRRLPSGTKVELVEGKTKQKPKPGYSRVRAPDGSVGYVPTKILQEEPVARARVAELESQLQELLRPPEVQVRSERSDTIEDVKTLLRQKQQLEQELATIRHDSVNIMEIATDRDRLRIQVSELTREREELLQDNHELRTQSNQRWFIIGVAVLAGGVLLGSILPRLGLRQRRGNWNSL